MSDPALRPISAEEYLRTEEDGPVKRELVGGFVYPLHGATRAQAGASRAHVLITGNVFGALLFASRRSGCRLYASDMKLRIEQNNSFYYPDVMLVCGQPEGDPSFETAPCLLVEVLSKRTAANDRRGKYAAYTALPGLQTYLIVSQEERRVYAYQREGDVWTLRELTGRGEIDLSYVGHALTLDEVYVGVLDAKD